MSDDAPWLDYAPAKASAPSSSGNDDEPWKDYAPAKSRAEPTSDEPKQTVKGGAQALASGINAGVADVAGLPVDTARKVVELGKAAAGRTYGALTSEDSTPESETLTPEGTATRTTHGLYHYVDPNTGADTFSKTPPPPGSKPYTHQTVSIPSFLQPTEAGTDFGSSESIKRGLNKFDVGTDVSEDTPLNRVLHAGAEAVPYAGLTPTAAVPGAVANFASGASGQTAKEAGASPLVQQIASVAGGLAPPAVESGIPAMARGVVRGGPKGQAAMQENLDNAKASGANLTLGQASGNKSLQYLEGSSAKLWGGKKITENDAANNANMGNRVHAIAEKLSNGSDMSPTSAGEAIAAGIGDQRTPGSTLGNMRVAENAAYDEVDKHVPPTTQIPASKTMGALKNLDDDVVASPGLVSGIKSRFMQKVEQNTPKDPMGGLGNTPPPKPRLSYEDMRAIKTRLGNEIDWGPSPSNPGANHNLKTLWGAVKDDIDSGVADIGGEAAEAQKNANALYAKNSDIRDSIIPIINKNGGPEYIYQAATNGTKLGASKINTVMSALNDDQKNLLRATVLNRMGRAIPSSQTSAVGETYSANTFMTNWQKMDPAAKDALFGVDSQYRKDLDAIAKTVGTIRSGTKLRNPSGTGEAVGHAGGIVAMWEGLKDLVKGSAATIGGVGAGVGGNFVLSHVLTNPRVVNWFAKTTKAPRSALPNAVYQLSSMKDPDAQTLAQYLNSEPDDRTQRASGGRVDHEVLVTRLINKWKSAKRATDNTTKPLLNVPDPMIAKALKIAGDAL